MDSDEKLIELANEGDNEAFEVLYRRYKGWVYRLAWRLTGNHESSLDVLQDTFAYLLGKFPGFKLSGKMTTFLYPVVKHISLGVLRRNSRYESCDEVIEGVVLDSAKGVEGQKGDLVFVLGVLPQEQREVLIMRFVDEMKVEEISEALNIPLGTVKSRLSRALEVLRNDGRTKDYFLE